VAVTVADNGRGFDPARGAAMFEPAVRLDAAADAEPAPEGAGMGLAICRRIMEAHGGAITARGEPGAGATFRLSFPAS
jgi:signal transduction histidine kinase